MKDGFYYFPTQGVFTKDVKLIFKAIWNTNSVCS